MRKTNILCLGAPSSTVEQIFLSPEDQLCGGVCVCVCVCICERSVSAGGEHKLLTHILTQINTIQVSVELCTVTALQSCTQPKVTQLNVTLQSNGSFKS